MLPRIGWNASQCQAAALSSEPDDLAADRRWELIPAIDYDLQVWFYWAAFRAALCGGCGIFKGLVGLFDACRAHFCHGQK